MCSIFSQDIKSCRSASRIGWFRLESVIGNTKCPKIFDHLISPFFCFLLHGLSECLLLLGCCAPMKCWHRMKNGTYSRGRSGKKMKQKEHKTLHWTLCLQICAWQWYSTPKPQCGALKEKKQAGLDCLKRCSNQNQAYRYGWNNMFYVSNDKVIKFINLTNLARPRENIKNSNIININIWKKLVIYRNDCVFYVLNFLIPLFFYILLII